MDTRTWNEVYLELVMLGNSPEVARDYADKIERLVFNIPVDKQVLIRMIRSHYMFDDVFKFMKKS